MPLVIFNYLEIKDNPNEQLDHFKKTIVLPRHALDKRWKLLAVNALYHDSRRENFQTLDVYIPELMSSEKVLYASEGIGVEKAEQGLRFYVNHHQTSQVNSVDREYSIVSYISDYPNLDLGFHDKSSGELNLICTARVGNGNREICYLSGYSIILEYEE